MLDEGFLVDALLSDEISHLVHAVEAFAQLVNRIENLGVQLLQLAQRLQRIIGARLHFPAGAKYRRHTFERHIV